MRIPRNTRRYDSTMRMRILLAVLFSSLVFAVSFAVHFGSDNTIFYLILREEECVRQSNLRTLCRKLSRERFTMTEEPGPPLSRHPSGSPVPGNPVFYFGNQEQLEQPSGPSDPSGKAKQSYQYHSRYLNSYKSPATIQNWNRYIILGLYAYQDGNEFERAWDQSADNGYSDTRSYGSTSCTSHLDRTLDIHPTLHAWATIVSQPYIIKHAPDFLEMNTLLSSSFKGMIAEDFDMADEDPESWQTVGVGKGKPPKRVSHQEDGHSNNQSPHKRIRPPLKTPTGTLAATASLLTPLTRPKGILHRPKGSPLSTQQQPEPLGTNSWDSSSQDLAAPHMPPPPSSRMRSKATKVPDHDTVTTDDSNMKQSAFKPNLNVATHDGTQRITIRWTLGNMDLLHTQNPGE